MKAKTKLTRLWGFLLALVMIVGMFPTTALAAGNYPAANAVSVDGGKDFSSSLYYKNTDTAGNFTGTSTDYNAAYDPSTGTLTLSGYDGGRITLGGASDRDLTIKLIGNNTVTVGSDAGIVATSTGCNIIITADNGSSGKLTINATSGSGDAYGIGTGLASGAVSGNVTITGYADVTINATTSGSNDYSFGIYAAGKVAIEGHAKVAISAKAPSITVDDQVYGIYAKTNVTIDTAGEITVDASNADNEANVYSTGVNSMGTLTLTKAGRMTVKWKGNSGVPFYPRESFSDTDHAINVDKTNCYASYRFGTPHTVEVVNGTLTGPGVLNAKSSGKFLENDTVSITPYERKGKSGEDIPFKGWTSSDVTLSSPTTAANSFTVPNKDVTVTAKHDPFDGTPTFTPTGTTNTTGTLTFKTKVKLGDGTECFYLAKDGEQNDESKYISFRTDNSPSTSPYEYNYETRTLPGINQVDEGDYYVVEKLDGTYYLSEKFTVNYTAPVTTYTVSFNANGGTGSMADVTGVSGEYTLPANGFTAPDGKQFKAWSVGGVEKAAGDKITVTANTTVTAVWEAIEYNVTVTGGTASVGAGTPITKATMGTTVTLTAGAAPSGQMFDKWVVNGVVVADANSATTTFVMPAGNVTAEATYKNAPHTHTFDQEIVKDAALKTAADCTHDAVYYKSCSCGAISTDDADTFTAINSALGHAWPEEGSWSKDADKHWYECSRCHLKKDEAAHDYGDDDICDICTYDNSVPHTHNLTLVDENPATCTTPGNKAYYTCDGCDKWFEDATGSVEITDKTSVILTANGHTPSDWKFDADNHWKECTVVGCGVIIEDSKAAHTASDWITDTEATATTDGTKHKECTECGYVMETGTIPATGGGEHTHSYGSDWKSNADKHWHECSCGAKAEEAAHTASDWITDTAATATTDGTKHKECTVCHRVLETDTIPATGSGEHTHSYSSDWKSDSINHWHECSCGVKDDVAAHSFKWVVDKEATATKKGSKHEECKFCGYQRPAVEIPATGSTTKPTDPTESNPNTGALDDVPQTGDNSNMILWIVLLLASGLGVTGTVVYSKRKKYAK